MKNHKQKTQQHSPLRIWAKEMHRITAQNRSEALWVAVINGKQVDSKKHGMLMETISSCFPFVCFLT